MAKRRPGKPKSDAAASQSVDIMNGEMPPTKNATPSPKRKRDNANEGSPASKRNAIKKAGGEVQEPRRSTRLSRPRAALVRRRAWDAGQQRSRDIMEVTTSPPPPKTNKAMKSLGKAKPVLDEKNSGFEGEEGEEGEAHSPITLTASTPRNHEKKGGIMVRVSDGKKPNVDLQLDKLAQRPQRSLTDNTKGRNNALMKPVSALPQSPKRASSRLHDQERRDTLSDEESERQNGVDGDQTSMDEAEWEHQDGTTSPQQSMDSVEHQNYDGQSDGAIQSSATKTAYERASCFYDCNESWESMLEAIRENLEEVEEGDGTSEIRELTDLIKNAKRAYLVLREADGANVEDKEYEIKELLKGIDERVCTLNATKDEKKDSCLVNDLYLQGIPKMVLLLKAALVTRSRENELSMRSLEELVKIIDATLSLCLKAYNWCPRPKLNSGVRRRTRNVIKGSLEALRKAYTQAQSPYVEKEKEARKVEKRQALADHVAKFLAQEQEKMKRAENNKRERHRDRVRQATTGDRLQANEFDIDELDLDGASHAPASNGTRSQPWRGTGVAAARWSLYVAHPATRDVPRESRERTEDIPGPMARKWSEEEDVALLKGLEKFTGAGRYLEIYQLYGSAGGPLSDRDVDEFMQRARFYKQSMVGYIEEERKKVGNVDRWAYLLSVDG